MKKLYILICIVLAWPVSARAQEKAKENIVQFSGLVLTADSLMGIHGVHILVKGTATTALSNDFGIFAIAAKPKDTIVFTSLGYKTRSYIVPETYTNGRYSMFITMTVDTLMVETVYVRPFMSKQLFQYYFVTMELPTDEMLAAAEKNLDPEVMKMQAQNMPASGGEAGINANKALVKKYYYAGGQVPSNPLLSPIAWAQFFKAWKNGDFKKKK